MTTNLTIGIIFFCFFTFSALADKRVTSRTLETLAIYPSIEIPASVVTMNDSKLSAEVSAVVKEIPVLIGESITQGEVLIKLDDRDYKLKLLLAELNLKSFQARLKLAKYQLKQANILIKQKAITDEKRQQRQAEVDIIIAELEAQKVSVAIAKRNVEKCFITAPFNAIVTGRMAQVGELANIGTPLVRIIDKSRIEVSARIQPQDVDALVVNESFLFTSRNQDYPIQLRLLTPAVDLIQRSQEARFQFTDARALPGTSGILHWKNTTPHVSSNLILRRNKQYGIFINKNNIARFLALDNALEGKASPVQLALDTEIIVDGRFTLQDGDNITIDK